MIAEFISSSTPTISFQFFDKSSGGDEGLLFLKIQVSEISLDFHAGIYLRVHDIQRLEKGVRLGPESGSSLSLHDLDGVWSVHFHIKEGSSFDLSISGIGECGSFSVCFETVLPDSDLERFSHILKGALEEFPQLM